MFWAVEIVEILLLKSNVQSHKVRGSNMCTGEKKSNLEETKPALLCIY